MKNYFNLKLVNDLINAIFPLPECFGLTCSEENGDELQDIFFLRNKVKKVDKDAKVLYGMSKLVIKSPHLNNIVIKIPFNGYWSETYYEDGNNDELEWVDFYQAPTEDGYDYCFAEYKKFKLLQKRKLGSFVAKTLFYREIDGFRIFLQELIYPTFEKNKISKEIPSKESTKLALQWKKERRCPLMTDANWIAKCIDSYGANKTKKFLKYCEEIDEDILSDCHNGNYGYRPDGTPALLDFSGFFS